MSTDTTLYIKCPNCGGEKIIPSKRDFNATFGNKKMEYCLKCDHGYVPAPKEMQPLTDELKNDILTCVINYASKSVAIESGKSAFNQQSLDRDYYRIKNILFPEG